MDFHGLFFADYQVEYIVSLSHCFFLRINFALSFFRKSVSFLLPCHVYGIILLVVNSIGFWYHSTARIKLAIVCVILECFDKTAIVL